MEKTSNVALYGGSWLAVISGLSLSDIGVLVGIFLSVAGFISNEIHKYKLRKIAREKKVIIDSE